MTGYEQWRSAVAAALTPAEIPATEEGRLPRAYIRGETPQQAAASMAALIFVNQPTRSKRAVFGHVTVPPTRALIS
jgi:hypothetical protein